MCLKQKELREQLCASAQPTECGRQRIRGDLRSADLPANSHRQRSQPRTKRPPFTIAMSRLRPSHLSVWLLVLVAAASCCNALHFYLDSNEKRCFLEEIPADTVVEGIVSQSVHERKKAAHSGIFVNLQGIIKLWNGMRRRPNTLRTPNGVFWWK